MTSDEMWLRLPEAVRDRIDGELRHRRVLPAIKIVWDGGGLETRPSLYEAQDLVMARMAVLSEQGLVEPEPIVTLADLIAEAKAVPDPVVAVEAVWDGDTYGWMVLLGLIVERPGRRHERFDEVWLTHIRRGGDIRLFQGVVPPWPEAAEATEKGLAIAEVLGVPFHFTQPDEPDIDLPRWWDGSVAG